MKTEQTLLQRLQELGTCASIASIIAAIVTTIATILGFSLNERLLYSLLALTMISIVYLVNQRQKVIRKIEDDGVMPRPRWFWRLVTHRIPSKPERLSKGNVMVVVPPKARDEAEILNSIHNQPKQFNLLFHHLPLPNPEDGKIDEDMGESELNKKKQPLVTFNDQLDNCAGVVLLDDCDWKKYEESYPKTWKVINDWSNKYTYRPVMSIRIGPGGTLNKYSYCNLSEIIADNQALLSRLLAQSTNRSKDWYDQATQQRYLFLALTLTLIIAFIISLLINYSFRNRIEQFSNRIEQVKAEMPKQVRVTTLTTEEQQGLTEHFASYRNSKSVVNPENQLLQGIVGQLHSKVIESSGVASDIDVIFFYLRNDPNNNDVFLIDEVVSTRPQLRHFGFAYNVNEEHSKSIVGCALARRSFVHWIGLDQSGKGTKDIQVWNLNGDSVGIFDGKQWKDGGKTCELGPPPISPEGTNKPDDPRQYLLCAPVGISKDSWVRPAGAICISSKADLKLNESWARQLLLQYGNLLSFFNWENALPK